MKQRLIDANEAENNLYGFTRYTGIDEAPYEYAETVISKLPTVEAIPIEWIKKYIAEEGIYPKRELLSVEQADAIERMIENWEKENETV